MKKLVALFSIAVIMFLVLSVDAQAASSDAVCTLGQMKRAGYNTTFWKCYNLGKGKYVVEIRNINEKDDLSKNRRAILITDSSKNDDSTKVYGWTNLAAEITKVPYEVGVSDEAFFISTKDQKYILGLKKEKFAFAGLKAGDWKKVDSFKGYEFTKAVGEVDLTESSRKDKDTEKEGGVSYKDFGYDFVWSAACKLPDGTYAIPIEGTIAWAITSSNKEKDSTKVYGVAEVFQWLQKQWIEDKWSQNNSHKILRAESGWLYVKTFDEIHRFRIDPASDFLPTKQEGVSYKDFGYDFVWDAACKLPDGTYAIPIEGTIAWAITNSNKEKDSTKVYGVAEVFQWLQKQWIEDEWSQNKSHKILRADSGWLYVKASGEIYRFRIDPASDFLPPKSQNDRGRGRTHRH